MDESTFKLMVYIKNCAHVITLAQDKIGLAGFLIYFKTVSACSFEIRLD